MVEIDALRKRWLRQSKESRDAVLRELRQMSIEWSLTDDEDGQEDALTLSVVVAMLDEIEKEKPTP